MLLQWKDLVESEKNEYANAEFSSCMDASTLKDCLQSVVTVLLDVRLLKMDSSLVANKLKLSV